ncbi:alpha-galactosidase [Candidatus Enterococcus ferrettii]|uniref:Alpha-galactosidase n=1 Tax=Candidatus Enterococcus ferrettii TaxID=2815324 RepID=A0ABV0EX17_9ENTE|nr:alpha-galactosidase [Enterococcus sp. 665A]MBO1339535.1 alpha-galactosidase [Enterococcus sp. 665A]
MSQELITFNKEQQVFHLSNGEISYIMKIEADNVLSHIYFGKTVTSYGDYKNYPHRDRGFSGNVPGHPDRTYSKDTLPQEFSSHGSMDYRIPASIIRRENGSNLHDFRYFNHFIDEGKPALAGLPAAYVTEDEEASTLTIILKDRDQEIYVDLLFTIYRNRAVIARSTKVRNRLETAINIERIASMQLDLTNNGMYQEVISLPGAHVRERQISRKEISTGIQTFESRRGASSHHMNSFVAIAGKDTNEFTGEVIGFNFVYSGNHAFELEKDQIDQLRIIAGINPYNFSWELKPKEEFQTPEVLIVYSDRGLNKMSDTYHHLLRERVARGHHQYQERPILVNNWEATYFDFTSQKVEEIVDEASDLGIEMFVLDDGWFGKRSSDNSSLGDWFEFDGKLENGLKGVADYVHQKGLKFGLWFEPEMISIDSELYREHPDFLMTEPGRIPSSSRDQHLLDMGRKEVREYIQVQMEKILDQVEIDYIKWDMNRSMSDAYSLTLSATNQGETAHRYILGVYELMENLTKKYPNILWEGCSGGGGRFDAGFLYYMPQSWASDNTDAVERLKIQYGTSLAYPTSAITAHVSAVPNHQTGRITSLKTRADVAMCGVFGYELDLTLMSEEEKLQVKEQVTYYQEIRQLVQFGNFIRLQSPFEGNLASWMFVSEEQDEALLFIGRVLANAQPVFNEVRLAGLDEKGLYEDTESGAVYSGSELMNIGLYYPDFFGDFQTQLIHLKRK